MGASGCAITRRYATELGEWILLFGFSPAAHLSADPSHQPAKRTHRAAEGTHTAGCVLSAYYFFCKHTKNLHLGT